MQWWAVRRHSSQASTLCRVPFCFWSSWICWCDFGGRIVARISHLGSLFVLVEVSSLNKMRIQLMQDPKPVPVKCFTQVEYMHLPDAEGRWLRFYKCKDKWSSLILFIYFYFFLVLHHQNTGIAGRTISDSLFFPWNNIHLFLKCQYWIKMGFPTCP